MTRTVVTDRERIAVQALERVAARGIATLDVVASADSDAELPTCPTHGPLAEDDVDCDCGGFQCPECLSLQPTAGPCVNRECLTAIARAAIDDLRRAS